jgi:hypothetical protein
MKILLLSFCSFFAFSQNVEIEIEKIVPEKVEQTAEKKYEVKSIFFTSYNPSKSQTDGDPCTGASGKDQCALAKNGVRMIALDRALLKRWGGEFAYGDTVFLETVDGTAGHLDPRCNGEFMVVDTMNSRFTGKNRGDIFFMKRADNISCTANVRKK